jgi:phytoene dehydrogenase-like protein
MSRNNTICDDPTVYVNITSKKCKGDAPKGKENWFVLINTPPNTGQDWDQLIQKTRMNVLNKLSRLLKRAIEPLIEVESILDPRSIELKTSSYQGALYGSSSNNRMAAFFRHKNFSSDIRGLYFCGGSVHPGGGIPLCLMGAAITASLIEQEYKL